MISNLGIRWKKRAAEGEGRQKGFTLIELTVVFFIIITLIALLLPATRTGREAARRTECRNNLHQIGLALHSYQEAFHALPPAFTVDEHGKRLHSWRTLLLPYLDQGELYKKIDLTKAWNDPVNVELSKRQVRAFCCPSSTAPDNHSVYLGIVGEQCCLRPGRGMALSEKRFNLSETLIAVEVAMKQSVPWMSPEDADDKLLGTLVEASAWQHSGRRHVLFADGGARALSMNVSKEELLAMAKTSGRDEALVKSGLER